jgi:hypothetical protein
MSSIELDPRLQQALDRGRMLEAHREEAVAGERPIGTTATLRKLGTHAYSLMLDRYRLDPPYGTDLGETISSHKTAEEALQAACDAGFSVADFHVFKPGAGAT